MAAFALGQNLVGFSLMAVAPPAGAHAPPRRRCKDTISICPYHISTETNAYFLSTRTHRLTYSLPIVRYAFFSRLSVD